MHRKCLPSYRSRQKVRFHLVMNKPELIEKARRDLGMTTTQAEKETVTSLRERLWSQKAAQDLAADPLCKVPKGLDGILKTALEQECALRGVALPEQNTRPKMIV